MKDYIGKQIGRYHVTTLIGRGGLSLVYKAFDSILEREVALKIIRHDAFDPNDQEKTSSRFSAEAKTLEMLNHPNIVHIYDYGVYNGFPYIVMELLKGRSLKQKMDHIFTPAEAVKILAPVADGLEYAHNKGIVHCDVKPSNIVLQQNGVPVLLDFGISSIIFPSNKVNAENSKIAIGTRGYMAPEQCFAKPVDGRTDEYALGIIFYEMIIGKKPFSDDIIGTHITVNEEMIHMYRLDPSAKPKEIPDNVWMVICKALELNPDKRYPTAGIFGAELKKLVGMEALASQKKEPDDENEKPFDPDIDWDSETMTFELFPTDI